MVNVARAEGVTRERQVTRREGGEYTGNTGGFEVIHYRCNNRKLKTGADMTEMRIIGVDKEG